MILLSFALIGFLGVTLTDERRRRCERMLRTAIHYSQQSLDCAAREAERDVRQFAREISGEQGALRALFKQPDVFFQWLGVIVAQEFGVPKEVKRAALLRRVATARKQQARMGHNRQERIA